MKNHIKYLIGIFFIMILPKRAKELSKKGMTIVLNLSFKERLMRYALLEKAKKEKDFETLSKFHEEFWINSGKEYFSTRGSSDNVLQDLFIPECSSFLDLLQKQLQKETEKYNMLVEIGTGEGTVLDYLSVKFPNIDRFIGIDLSISQIEANKKLYNKNAKLEFVVSDGFDWINKNGQDHMIIVTCGGVLEYFTESRIEAFFNELHKIGKIIFIAIEPIGVNHDFSKNPNSEVYGYENSFSHNYAKIFKNSGFTIWHQSKIYPQPHFYMDLIAAKN